MYRTVTGRTHDVLTCTPVDASPHSDDVVEMLKLPQTEKSVLVGVEVVKQQLRLVALQGKLILQHEYGVLLGEAASQVAVDVLLEDALHLGSVNQKQGLLTNESTTV